MNTNKVVLTANCKGVNIVYPQRDANIDLTRAEYNLIHRMLQVGERVSAIKFVRDQYNLGLYEAKMIVDAIAASHHIPPTSSH